MAWLDFIKKKSIDVDVGAKVDAVKGDHERIKKIKRMFEEKKILLDSRTKQRVVVRSLSYAVLDLDNFTVVIAPVKSKGRADRSFMYDESEGFRFGRTKKFNEYFDEDPSIIYDNIDFLKPINQSQEVIVNYQHAVRLMHRGMPMRSLGVYETNNQQLTIEDFKAINDVAWGYEYIISFHIGFMSKSDAYDKLKSLDIDVLNDWSQP